MLHRPPRSDRPRDPHELVAIVGMAGRFPGADSPRALWELLLAQRDAIGPLPSARGSAQVSDPCAPRVGGFLDDVADLDPTFFGISPREAEEMDPQQRLMLEVAWLALEDAGQRAAALRGSRTGVYVGASWRDYELVRRAHGCAASPHSAPGNALDVIAGRLSYWLQLRGPSLTIETGCSSSLVALHLACQSLRSGEIDGAIVGGVNLILAPDVTDSLARFGALSRAGRCQAFAAGADGFVRGEGVVALYVKTVARALADGDHIHAVIAGSAVNNDGGGDSLVTPSEAGQVDVLERAYLDARVDADDVAFVEAHGTGTAVGDPVEAGALGRALGRRRCAAAGPLPIGSVKTNLGHLEAAAGLAGLVKAVLALTHRVVPATIVRGDLSPAIPFGALNVCVLTSPLALPSVGVLHAGVSSFGWGGTNAHVVLQSAPPIERARRAPAAAGPIAVPLSAHSEAALRQRASELRDAARAAETPQELAELAGTLAWRRDALAQRAAFVVETGAELAGQLAAYAASPNRELAGVTRGVGRSVGRVAFVFPGQGAQWWGMGRELLTASPVFAAAIARCSAALAPYFDGDLAALLAGCGDASALDRVEVVQPLAWAMAVALAELWRAAGIEPDVVIGHSQGEIAAATIAGALSYEDAARVVAQRSALVQRAAAPGRMLAVELGAEAALAALAGFEDRIALAAYNGPTSCVLAGDPDAIAVLEALLEADGVLCRPVRVDYASHSHHMDAISDALARVLAGIEPRSADAPMVSTVTAERIAGEALDADYWARNLRAPVRFADAMTRALEAGVTHVVEVSPHPVLALAIAQIAAAAPAPVEVVTTLRRGAGSPRDFAAALAQAFVAGLAPFRALPAAARCPVPAYPWQRQRCWPAAAGSARRAARIDELVLTPAVDDPDAWRAELEVGLAGAPWLGEHAVHGTAVVPGALVLALAAAAVRARAGADPVALVDVQLASPIAVRAEPTRALVELRTDAYDGDSFTLWGLPPASSAWIEHATGRVAPHAAVDAPPFPGHLLSCRADAAEAIYAACAARGLEYGPGFRRIERVFIGDAEALGVLQPGEPGLAAESLEGRAKAWDGALQVCLALGEGAGALLPVRVGQLALASDRRGAAVRWVYAVRRGSARFDLALWDEHQRPIATIEGLELAPLATEPAQTRRVAGSLVELCFEPAPPAQVDPIWAGAAWAVWGAPRDAAALVDTLARSGCPEAVAVDDVAAAREWLAHRGRSGQPAGLALVAPDAQAGLAAQRQGLAVAAQLVGVASAAPTAPRVAIVTREALAAAPADLPDPGAALYWGLGRVAQREHPALRVRLIDLTGAPIEGADAAARELLALDDEDQVALRPTGRLAARIVPSGAAGHAHAAAPWRLPRQPFQLHVRAPGRADGLEYRALHRRAPGLGEIEVEVAAAALNFMDVMMLMGTYPGGVAALGGECAGRVIAVGPGVTRWRVGDRVVACGRGSMASHVTVRADHAQPIPAGLDDATAAALPLVMTTAWHALAEVARTEPGETVLIHSAAGGLGLAAIQVAHALGARVIATAGSREKQRHLAALGVSVVLGSRDRGWVDGVRAATGGRGVDVVLSSLGGGAIAAGLEVLAEGGRFLEVGKHEIHRGRRLGLAAFRKALTFSAIDLAGLLERRPERFAAALGAAWAQVCAGTLGPLPTTRVPFGDAATAFGALASGKQIGKLVLTAPESVHDVRPEPTVAGRLRADATYVITGGFGALGLSLAEHFADLGAGALALIGRAAPSAEVLARLARLRERGVRVEALVADVTEEGALAGALVAARSRLPPLRGVVHAAGVLDDATLAHLDAERLERVLAPKVDGARHLDEATATDPLDFFVLFSSAAALVGNPGQAAYAAANTYLDGLAAARRRRGLPALSVQWGPFLDIGLAAADERRGARLADRGMAALAADSAWAALLELMRGDAPVVSYVALDARRWLDAYPDAAAQPVWRPLLAASHPSASTGSAPGLLAALRERPEPERQLLAERAVRDLVSRVLRLELSERDRETPFKALGLDSLLGIELRNRVESAFGVHLPSTVLWTYGSSRALASALCERASAAS